jgi:hypothetical protein
VQAWLLSSEITYLKEGGKYLLVEPKIHTSQQLFDDDVEICKHIGFDEISRPQIRISRAVLFRKNIK